MLKEITITDNIIKQHCIISGFMEQQSTNLPRQLNSDNTYELYSFYTIPSSILKFEASKRKKKSQQGSNFKVKNGHYPSYAIQTLKMGLGNKREAYLWPVLVNTANNTIKVTSTISKWLVAKAKLVNSRRSISQQRCLMALILRLDMLYTS